MSATSHSDRIVIRPATIADADDLRRLAQLDSARVPAAPLLVAEVDGRLRAARSLRDGGVVADPFAPSERLLILLELHATEPRWGRASRARSAWAAGAAVLRALRNRGEPEAPISAPAPVAEIRPGFVSGAAGIRAR
jgi:hypothetical protein